jgi:K+-transporting ATPase KdpF subunit
MIEARGVSRGCRLFVGGRRFLGDNTGASGWMRRFGEKEMTWSYGLSGALALGLLIYLVVALIRAEDL